MDPHIEGDNMTTEQDLGQLGVPLEGLEARINAATQGRWQAALNTDQYEVATQALDEVTGLRTWRDRTRPSSFSSFYNLFETATELRQASASPEERGRIADQLVANARSLSPRVRDLYMGLLSQMDGSSYTPQFEMTEAQLTNLRESGDLALLQSPNVPWNLKLNRMETRIESELRGRKALDRREKEAQESQGQEKEFPTMPPSAGDESKSGMDEMQRLKEGEQAPAIWTITPGFGGYYKEQSFDTWDSTSNTWRQSKYHYSATEPLIAARAGKETDLKLKVQLEAGKPVRAPVTYKHRVVYGYAEDRDSVIGIVYDQNGDVVIMPQGSNTKKVIEATLVLEVDPYKAVSGSFAEVLSMPATLTEETEQKLKDVANSRQGNIAKARALASYTMRRLEYSNDSSLNSVYENDPDGYAGAIDKVKKADCDVAGTYFATLCSKLDIPVRHVVGHMVKGKDKEGNSRITSGTGHAWTEVWDEQNRVWVRIDATPPGDPQLEEEQQNGDSVPGDYDEQEAIGPTDEQLQSLQEKLSQLAEELSYTQEERELAKATNIEISEARKIVKEIQEAENTRLPSGERVVDVMSQLWSLITQSRTTTSPDYTGPLRKREGGEEIEDIVAHKIGIRGGDFDPASREKETIQQFTEQIISAMQLRMVGDKSGSMSQTVDGEKKWKMQRQAMYLILSSLDRAQRNLQRVNSLMINPLAIQTEVISFRGGGEIDVDKPLSNNFSMEDKVKLWQSLGNQGSGNGDVPALRLLFDEITQEREQMEKAGKSDDTLRVIIACSDGEPDSVEGVHQMVDKLGQLNAVVVGVGMTETAAKVPLIFTTDHSKGDLARDINDLPAIVAKHVVTQAIKLFPEKSRAGYQRSIDTILAKFDNVGIKS